MFQKMCLIFLFVFSTIFVFGQKADERIILESEKDINCQIMDFSDEGSDIAYMEINGVAASASLDEIESYAQNTEINPIMPDVNNVRSNVLVPNLNFQNNQNLGMAGQERVRSANTAKIGYALLFVGSISLILPTVMNEGGNTATNIANRRKVFTTVGVIASAAGLVAIFTSVVQTRRAGKLVQVSDNLSLNQTRDGVGLVLNLK